MPLSPFPPAPIPGSETFEVDAGRVLDAIPSLVDEINALQADVSEKQDAAALSATAALGSKNAAAGSATDAAAAKTAAEQARDRTIQAETVAQQDAVATAADRVQTGFDRQATTDKAAAAAISSSESAANVTLSAQQASIAMQQAVIASGHAASAATSATTSSTKASEATSAASSAVAASSAINVTANVSAWSAATNYAVGTVVYSTSNYQNYRRIVAGISAVDPKDDLVNWRAVGFGPSSIGTEPNQAPLNQYLGRMAYQSPEAVMITGGVIDAQIRRRAPVTKTAAFAVADNEHWLICNGTASITVTLPDAATNMGREIMLKTIAAFTVVSASSNVIPLAGGAAGTAILAAAAGKYATLVSDGINWIITQAN